VASRLSVENQKLVLKAGQRP